MIKEDKKSKAEILKNEIGSDLPFYIFIGITVLFLMLTFVMLLIDGERIYCIIWSGESYGNFPDFFQTVQYVNDPNALYSAGVYLIMDFIRLFIPSAYKSATFHVLSGTVFGKALGWGLFLLITAAFVFLIFKFYKGNMAKKVCLIICLILSTPYIYMFERGNLTGLSAIGVMAFLFLYDGNRAERAIAYTGLCVAVLFKIFPAVLGLILIKEKKYRQAVFLASIGIIVFFVPYLFVGGLDAFKRLFLNLDNYETTYVIFGTAYKANIRNGIQMLFDIFNIDKNADKLGRVFSYIYMAVAMGLFALTKKKWLGVGALISLMVGCMPFSWTYTLLYMVPVIIMYLNEKETGKKKYFYSAIFAILFALIPFGKPGFIKSLVYSNISVNLASVVEQMAFLLLSAAFTAELIIEIIRRIKGNYYKKGNEKLSTETEDERY